MLKKSLIIDPYDDRPRMWMFDDYLEVIVWYQPDQTIYGIQICYDKMEEERALTWLHTGSYTHSIVANENTAPGKNLTQTLTNGGYFDKETLKTEFETRSIHLEPELRKLVLSIIIAANVP